MLIEVIICLKTECAHFLLSAGLVDAMNMGWDYCLC